METPHSGSTAIKTDMASSIAVIQHVGAWMRDNQIGNYSKWWDPDQVCQAMLEPYAKSTEFFVVEVDGVPAATAIMQTEQSLQDWSAVDQDNPAPPAVYVHYVAVERDFAGHRLVAVLIEKAVQLAQEKGVDRLRLDTNAQEPRLCALYEGLGFKRVGTEDAGDHVTAFYEKRVAAPAD